MNRDLHLGAGDLRVWRIRNRAGFAIRVSITTYTW